LSYIDIDGAVNVNVELSGEKLNLSILTVVASARNFREMRSDDRFEPIPVNCHCATNARNWRMPFVPGPSRNARLKSHLARSPSRQRMPVPCAFETFGVGESTFGGHVCRAGPTGAVVTKNSPRRGFWEELGEARQIAGALIF
jgi:hypothetical protein